MYAHLKTMLSAAETLGQIQKVRQTTKDRYYGDGIEISGTTADGREFTLELTIKENANDRN